MAHAVGCTAEWSAQMTYSHGEADAAATDMNWEETLLIPLLCCWFGAFLMLQPWPLLGVASL